MFIHLHIFGVNEMALRLPSILLTTIGIWLTFLIGKYFFDKKTAFLAAFFYSINGLIIELTAGRVPTDHVDIFFLFFIELTIYLSILFATKGRIIYNILAGICLGAAILSKWLPALIVLPIWLLLVYESGHFNLRKLATHFTVLLLTCAAIFLPWQIYIHTAFPLEAGWESSFNFKHLTEVIEERTGPFYYFINKLRINYGELIYLPIVWFLWKLSKDLTNWKRLALCIWFLIPLIIFSMVKTKMQAYILFTSPALFLITSAFYYMLIRHRSGHPYKWFFIVILILLIALPVRYTLERVKPFEQKERSPQWVKDLKELDEEKIENGILFNYEYPVEAMFYTDLVAYPELPDRKTIDKVIADGYTIILNDNGLLPDRFKSVKGIRVRKLSTDK